MNSQCTFQNKNLAIGLGVGLGIVFLVFIGIGIYYCMQRKKRTQGTDVQVYEMAPQPGYAYPTQYQYPNNGKTILQLVSDNSRFPMSNPKPYLCISDQVLRPTTLLRPEVRLQLATLLKVTLHLHLDIIPPPCCWSPCGIPSAPCGISPTSYGVPSSVRHFICTITVICQRLL